MLDHRERFVEVVEDFPPLLIFRSASESLGVILQSFPSDEQEVPGAVFDAPVEPGAIESRASTR